MFVAVYLFLTHFCPGICLSLFVLHPLLFTPRASNPSHFALLQIWIKSRDSCSIYSSFGCFNLPPSVDESGSWLSLWKAFGSHLDPTILCFPLSVHPPFLIKSVHAHRVTTKTVHVLFRIMVKHDQMQPSDDHWTHNQWNVRLFAWNCPPSSHLFPHTLSGICLPPLIPWFLLLFLYPPTTLQACFPCFPKLSWLLTVPRSNSSSRSSCLEESVSHEVNAHYVWDVRCTRTPTRIVRYADLWSSTIQSSPAARSSFLSTDSYWWMVKVRTLSDMGVRWISSLARSTVRMQAASCGCATNALSIWQMGWRHVLGSTYGAFQFSSPLARAMNGKHVDVLIQCSHRGSVPAHSSPTMGSCPWFLFEGMIRLTHLSTSLTWLIDRKRYPTMITT